MMDWLSHINGAGWAAILTPTIMVLLTVFSKKSVKPDADGWIKLRPSIGLSIFGFAFVAFAVFFSFYPIAAFFIDANGFEWGIGAMGVPLAILFWYGVYTTFIVKTRFNDQGIEHKGLIRTVFVQWEDITGITESVWLGTYVRSRKGRLIIWKLLRGFQQLVDAASERGVEIDPTLLTSK